MSNTNSFSSLGFKSDEATVEALRSDLADIVRGYIDRSRLSQTALGRKLGIPQSTISAIKRDRIDRLSIEYFIRILTRANIPWTAKCWDAPHDAAWVAGGLSQLTAADRQVGTIPAIAQPNYLDPIPDNRLYARYVISGKSGSVRSEVAAADLDQDNG